MKDFKPILAPNEQPDLKDLKYPLLASDKLDGIRCIFYKGQILSRSLKPIVNKQLREKFEPIRQYSESQNLILDGEIYSPKLTFQEITSYVMTEDLTSAKSIKKDGIRDIPDHLKFYCFDSLDDTKLETFETRIMYASCVVEKFPEVMEMVWHKVINNSEMITTCFDQALKNGCEGLILRDPRAGYKYGRGTLKEGIIFKVKPFVTFDAQVTGVVQSTEVDPNAEKKINELGRSVTSKKKDDRILIEKASAFWVEYEGKPLKVVLAMTDPEKEEVWKNRDSYIGRWIEYKGMKIGAKDVPRHPVLIRMRPDKND